MKNDQSLLFALGIAQKAGKAVSGDFAVQDALRKGKVKLLLIAKDASENSRKRLINLDFLTGEIVGILLFFIGLIR